MAVAVVGESTFLTSLNADRKKAEARQLKREELLAPMERGQLILKHYADLQSLADDLDSTVQGKLNANENAFFQAYRDFMQTVRKELTELQQKADEEETKNRRETKIQSLQKRLDWFMNEALRLDELCKRYKKELDKWKGKAEALKDDQEFLENQIKQAKRNNKTLRGSVEKAQTSAYSALVATDVGRQQSTLPPAALPSLQDAQQSPSEECMRAPEDSPAVLSKELETRYQKTIQRLKQQLETEQRLVSKMRAVTDRQFDEPSELEALFMRCVAHVKSEVEQRRRQQSEEQNSRKRRGSRKDHSEPPAAAASVTTDDFTVMDRRRVVELLLNSREVLTFLHDKIFPVENASDVE
mmetsp:Transcript_43406/g.86081  ORF Transcript_43406/g.86081 Transcript_43406/m.86081 type:complete len:355 (-) Transcript_43406:81-1145(-)